MKKLLFGTTAVLGIALSGGAWAACATATVQVKDNLAATPNMEITNGGGTNCVGEVALVEGGALIAAANALHVQPGTGATWAATESGTWTVQPGNTPNTSPWLFTHIPSSASGAAAAYTSSSALAANQVVKASAGNLYSFQVSADSTLSGAAWWVLIYDATSAPVDGAVTPAKCYAMPSGTTFYAAAFPTPLRLATGITIGVSTTGCFTKTASTHAFISGDAL